MHSTRTLKNLIGESAEIESTHSIHVVFANPWYDSSACPFKTFSYMRQPYLQGYIIEPEKIRKFLGIQDPNDRRIDDVFCKILGALDLEKHPIHFHDRDEKTADVVLLLSPDAVADDIKTLEAKRLQPSNVMTQLANTFFTGPCILPYDINQVGSLSVWFH